VYELLKRHEKVEKRICRLMNKEAEQQNEEKEDVEDKGGWMLRRKEN